MLPKRDNYAIQAEDARLRFLTYDQSAMPVQKDAKYLYLPFCGFDYRISRADGHIFRRVGDNWLPADSHGEVLTIFDYLCDAKPHRTPAGVFFIVVKSGQPIGRPTYSAYHTSLALSSGFVFLWKKSVFCTNTFCLFYIVLHLDFCIFL